MHDVRQKVRWLELQLSRAGSQSLRIAWDVVDNVDWPLFKDDLLEIFIRLAPIERWCSLRVHEFAPRHFPFFKSLVSTKTFNNLELFVWEAFEEERHTMIPFIDAHLPPPPESKFRRFRCDMYIIYEQLQGSIATLIQYTSRFWTRDIQGFGKDFLPSNVHDLLMNNLPDFPLPHVLNVRTYSLNNLNPTTLPHVVSLSIQLIEPRTLHIPVEFDALRDLTVRVVEFQLLEMIRAPNLHWLSIRTPVELSTRQHYAESLRRVYAQGSQYTLAPSRLSINHTFPLDILQAVVRRATQAKHLDIKFRNTYDMAIFINKVLFPTPSTLASSLAVTHGESTCAEEMACPELVVLALDFGPPDGVIETSSPLWRVDRRLIVLYGRRLLAARKGMPLEAISLLIDDEWKRFDAAELDGLFIEEDEENMFKGGYDLDFQLS